METPTTLLRDSPCTALMDTANASWTRRSKRRHAARFHSSYSIGPTRSARTASADLSLTPGTIPSQFVPVAFAARHDGWRTHSIIKSRAARRRGFESDPDERVQALDAHYRYGSRLDAFIAEPSHSIPAGSVPGHRAGQRRIGSGGIGIEARHELLRAGSNVLATKRTFPVIRNTCGSRQCEGCSDHCERQHAYVADELPKFVDPVLHNGCRISASVGANIRHRILPWNRPLPIARRRDCGFVLLWISDPPVTSRYYESNSTIWRSAGKMRCANSR